MATETFEITVTFVIDLDRFPFFEGSAFRGVLDEVGHPWFTVKDVRRRNGKLMVERTYERPATPLV